MIEHGSVTPTLQHTLLPVDSLRGLSSNRPAAGSDRLPEAWSLAVGEYHVWCAELAAGVDEITSFQGALSRSELERAGRFRFENDRDAYIVRRGILRKLLGGYLGASPDHLEFSSNVWGKPYLARPWDLIDLRFSLSHSKGLALYAFARGREIGVDIECVRPFPDWISVAQRVLSPDERVELNALPPEARLPAFFNGWTRKEAVLKALGEGIGAGMERVEVSLTTDNTVRLLGIRGDTTACVRWSLHHLVPAPGFVAAAAVHTPDIRFVQP